MIYSGYMPHNQDRADEWTDSELNAPLEECAICGCGFSSEFEGIVCPDCNEAERTESAENEPDEWPDEPGDEQCADIFEQVEQAPLVKPTGPCVKLKDHNGVEWNI